MTNVPLVPAPSRFLPLLPALLSAACGGDGASDAAARGAPEIRVIPVEVAPVEVGSAARVVTVTGTVEPIRTVGINSQLSGAVLSVSAEEGDRVRAGQVLARLDDRELGAQLTSAEMGLEVARRTAERAEELKRQQYITEVEYDRDQAAWAAARATRDQLRARVGYATVRAPSAGVVLEKRVEAGDVVAPQARLFTIGDVSTLVVRVPVSELDVSALDPGDSVAVALDALGGRTLVGRIRRVFPAADTVTRLVPVEVSLTGQAAREARPGFLARLRFRLEPRGGVLLVPQSAVAEGPGGASVFVMQAGRVARRQVVRGDSFEGRVEIREGLAPGDTVVTAGGATLRENDSVRVVLPPG
ncbi:MAG: efflux RND transporter periplasmic adaptor subunit, partial [Gemmatimonadales bacterium]